MTYALAYAVVFLKISLAVTQQRNVEEGRVKLIPCLSMVMQFVECATWGIGVHAFATQDWLQVGFMGLGAGTGSLAAMWVDRHWLARKAEEPGKTSIGRALRKDLGGAWSKPRLKLVRPNEPPQ